MCEIDETYHIYTGCKRLHQTHADTGAVPSGQELPADHGNIQSNQEQGSLLGRVFSRFWGDVSPMPRDVGDNNAPLEDEAAELEPHKVRIKFIRQCPRARGNGSLHQDIDQRRCLEPHPPTELEDLEEYGVTRWRRSCPVCEAIEQAERDALDTTKIVSNLPLLF